MHALTRVEVGGGPAGVEVVAVQVFGQVHVGASLMADVAPVLLDEDGVGDKLGVRHVG